MEYIKRNYEAEFRADEDTGVIEGVPIVFNSPTDIGGSFREIIVSGALDLTDKSDVRFFWNHNIDEKAIARTIIPLEKKGGMVLEINQDKVLFKANINRKRTDANDLALAIEDGVINSMSFMFGVEEDRWEGLDTEYPTRYITKINPLIEVSAVNFPAYKQTSIGVRSTESTESDLEVLEKARTLFNKRSTEIEQKKKQELELAKLKALYL